MTATRREVIKTELRELALGDMGCGGYLTGARAPTILFPAVRLDRFPFHDGRQRCRACGCTEEDCSACAEQTGEPCGWIEPDLCSACALPQGAGEADDSAGPGGRFGGVRGYFAEEGDETGYLGAWDIADEWCETCHGTGTVGCHCGGDLCVCRNHGERPCPSC